jgi:predicted metal-dependent peptidase
MNPLQEQEKKELEKIEIGREILRNARNELYLGMRFLDVALSSLVFTPDFQVNGVGCDGYCLYYEPEALIVQYRKGRVWVNRAYLHMIFHCLFRHIWGKKDRDTRRWNLACDIGAEYIIDGLYHRSLSTPQSVLRRKVYQICRDRLKVVTAQGVYQVLEEMFPHGEIREGLSHWETEFYVDDHSKWTKDHKEPPKQQMQQRWDDIRDKMQTEMETFSKEAAEDSKSLTEQLQVENRKRYDYKEFLRKFSVIKEEVKVDLDTFDYIFYHYGISLYGNMPLIEPQETKEIKKVQDFVIVIDTSMSCKGELVKRFLEETYSVLSETESFFHKVKIHMIQCDEKVQQDQVITKREELKAYMEHFQVVGQGGTDFRPAFTYVDTLISQGAFEKLKGLIYFTDGYGTYPAVMPPYDTAFVFLKEDYQDVDVPPWAMKLILEPEDLKETPWI